MVKVMCDVDNFVATVMYAVIKFKPTDPEDTEEVEAVPVAWLSPGRTHCRWPTFRSTDAISRAIRNQMPPGTNWTTYDAEVMRLCGMSYSSVS